MSNRFSSKRRLNALTVALALALPGSAALAASMDDVVKTRSDQNIDEQYGRDSVYAFSPDAKPLKPEQTASRDTNIFGTMKTYAADAWHKTEGFAAGLWGKTTGLFQGHESATVAQAELQPYGRAGGYVGADRIAVLNSAESYQANGTPLNGFSSGHATASAPNDVKTGAAPGAADGLGGPPESAQDSTNMHSQ
jgi:hypothetical protein